MTLSVWLLFAALGHSLHGSPLAATSLVKLLSPMSQVNRRTEKELPELLSSRAKKQPVGRGCGAEPLVGLGTINKRLEDEQTADSSALNVYDTECTHSELGVLSQEHQDPPLSSAASGGTWGQSVFFSLVTWSKSFESPRKRKFPQSMLKYENRRKIPGSSAFNLTFQKCAEVNEKTLMVKLMISNLNVHSPFNISQLTILDAISGLNILSNIGNETELGFQTYTKESLQAGEHYIINYTATLKADEPEEEKNISLPAYLTIGSSVEGTYIQIGQLQADFILVKKASIWVSPDHGINFVGFIIAFIVSFVLACSILITILHLRRVAGRNLSLWQMKRMKSNTSPSVTDDGAECFNENILLQDRVIDIFLLEDPQNMARALDDLHVLNAIQLDTDLEYHRKRMNLAAIFLLLRNFKHNKDLSPLLEERFNIVFKEQFEEMENTLSTEHEEMLATLAAQSNQETRHKMEVLYIKQLQEDKEAELLMQNVDDEFQLEMLMDQQLAFQRKLLEENLAVKKNLVKRIQSSIYHRRHFWNTAALQITDLIQLVKNAGYLTEAQMKSLLEMVHQEILFVKLGFDEVMDQEKKVLHHKLVSERRQHISRRISEHEHQGKELSSLFNISGDGKFCHNKCLLDWHNLLKNQAAELGELVEKLDKDALDQLETLEERLNKDASLRIKTIYTGLACELLHLGVPKEDLKQMAESQEKETNLLHEKQRRQEENEKHKVNESLEKIREELSNQLQSEIEDQNFLRHQKYLLLQNMMKSVLILSEVEIQQIMQSFLDIFCQIDKSLALPQLSKNFILQAHMNNWRKTSMEKLELQWSKQNKLKTKERGHDDQLKLVVWQERTRHKLKLYNEETERAAEESIKVCAELLHQRVNQMKDLEENFGSCMASIQLRRAERRVRALEIHTAILNLQGLLLEEMVTAGLQCEPTCTQVLQEHICDLERLVCMHSDRLQHELTVESGPSEWNSLIEMQSRPLTEDDTAQNKSQMLTCLNQAMSKCKDTVEAESQRLRVEERSSQLLEDVKEQLGMKTLLRLQDQELKLAANLIQHLSIPMDVFQTLLKLLLPYAFQEELTLFANKVYPERNVNHGINKDKLDDQKKRKLWESIELKLRNKIIGENLENMNIPCSRRGSILKKKRLQLLKQVSFPQSHGFSEFPDDDHPELINEGAGQMIKMADTGEEVFVFRIKKDDPCSADAPPKKKKRNFLNFKRSAVANLDQL
ncbi:limbin-like isoform X3 [Narcine bancroftii]|uniref:limbin-like isoform X3 n=1 Tax=Narcine bancroftii TaxID=1343680 RepID=UPI00383148D5